MKKYTFLILAISLIGLPYMALSVDGINGEKEKEREETPTSSQEPKIEERSEEIAKGASGSLTSLPRELQTMIFSNLEPNDLNMLLQLSSSLAPVVREVFFNKLQEKHPLGLDVSQVEKLYEAATKGGYTHLIKRIELWPISRSPAGEDISITYGTIRKIAQFHELTEFRIKLPQCTNPQVTDDAITELAQNCRKLEILLLSDCPNITNISLIAIGKNCHELTEFSLQGAAGIGKGVPESTGIPNNGVTALAKGCMNLKSLSLPYCNNVEDDDVIEVVKECPNLTRLFLRECPKITDKSIDAILEYCKNLKELGVGRTAVTKAAAEKLKELRPNIEVNIMH